MNNKNNIQSSESLSFQPSSSLPGFIELLKQSLNIYRQNLSTLLIVIFLIATFNFIRLKYINFITISNIPIFTKLTVISLSFLVYLIFLLWGFCAITYLIKDISKKGSFIESYHKSLQIMPLFLWLSFLRGFIILGALIFFIIPGIIFSIWFIFAPYILVNENLKGMDALLKSREYVRGYWWEIFWRLIIVLILIAIVYLPFLFLSSKNFISENVYQFIMNLIWSFLFSLQTIYVFMLYRSLQFIKGKFNFQPLIVQKIQFINIGILGILVIINILFDISVDILTLFSKFLI